ncbi:MAG: hypothetical protein AAFZ65_04160 [Planctomycetota bacterium]
MRWALLIAGLLVLALAGAVAEAEGATLEPTVEVDILTLTTIDWKPGDELPKSVRDLSGKRVVIRGYMHGSIDEETRRFPFVSDSCQCTARLMPHHFVDVLVDEETAPIAGQFEIIGRLNVGPRLDDDGFVTSVYRLKGEIY